MRSIIRFLPRRRLPPWSLPSPSPAAHEDTPTSCNHHALISSKPYGNAPVNRILYLQQRCRIRLSPPPRATAGFTSYITLKSPPPSPPTSCLSPSTTGGTLPPHRPVHNPWPPPVYLRPNPLQLGYHRRQSQPQNSGPRSPKLQLLPSLTVERSGGGDQQRKENEEDDGDGLKLDQILLIRLEFLFGNRLRVVPRDI
jgi:hypothetical protein